MPQFSAPVQRLLIVDDYPRIGQLIAEVFRAHHFCVTTALSARDALGLANERSFDLALLDWHLPGMDGIELARKLMDNAAARNEPLAIWLMTGSDLASVAARADAAGCLGVVQKPLQLNQLMHLLQAHQFFRV